MRLAPRNFSVLNLFKSLNINQIYKIFERNQKFSLENGSKACVLYRLWATF